MAAGHQRQAHRRAGENYQRIITSSDTCCCHCSTCFFRPAVSLPLVTRIWLEALTRTGQGHRIDILPVPPDALAPEIFPERDSRRRKLSEDNYFKRYLLLPLLHLLFPPGGELASSDNFLLRESSRKVEYFPTPQMLTFSCDE
jgi:hypothetical protein